MAAAEYRTATSTRIFLISLPLSFLSSPENQGHVLARICSGLRLIGEYYAEHIHAGPELSRCGAEIRTLLGRRARPGQKDRHQRQRDKGHGDKTRFVEQTPRIQK